MRKAFGPVASRRDNATKGSVQPYDLNTYEPPNELSANMTNKKCTQQISISRMTINKKPHFESSATITN